MLQAADLTIRLHPADDVVIARTEIATGTLLSKEKVSSLVTIPAGHKLAVRDLAQGAPVRRYNQIIGFATRPIKAGEHVHVHNMAMGSFERDYAFCRDCPPPSEAPAQRRTWMGYDRGDGRYGTRNYIAIISTVNCSASTSKYISERFRADDLLRHYPNVDGVVAIVHGSGCGMGAGVGFDILRRTLTGYADHVNFAGMIMIGLGCEVNQVAPLMDRIASRNEGLFASLTIQDEGGTQAAIEAGIAAVRAMLPAANAVARTTVSASHLVLGLQCGASDGYSGISGNPVLGVAVDMLVENGGTAILSETPEIYGAEHLLTARASSAEVAEKLMQKVRWWESYTAANSGDMNNNPSPGNKAGGITTILEKSLGAVAKAGSTGLMDVYDYAEKVDRPGLVFMDTPGYDPVSATGQVAGGANVICFTTGRGSAYGCKPTPSLKIATTSGLFNRMRLDMDFNAGTVVDGTSTLKEAGADLFHLILKTASGTKTCSELLGLGDNEFVPWQIGAVM